MFAQALAMLLRSDVTARAQVGTCHLLDLQPHRMKRFNDVSYERAMYGIEYAGLGMLQYAEKQRSCLRPNVKRLNLQWE